MLVGLLPKKKTSGPPPPEFLKPLILVTLVRKWFCSRFCMLIIKYSQCMPVGRKTPFKTSFTIHQEVLVIFLFNLIKTKQTCNKTTMYHELWLDFLQRTHQVPCWPSTRSNCRHSSVSHSFWRRCSTDFYQKPSGGGCTHYKGAAIKGQHHLNPASESV